MKVAIVHDDLVQFGGAERVVLCLHEMFPDAPIYTSFASERWQEIAKKEKINLVTSFMQKLPGIETLYRAYALALLFPLAFERFDFSDFKVVISSSSRFAHGIITKPNTVHLCFRHSPPRMLWETNEYFKNEASLKGRLGKVFKTLSLLPISYMRLWDYTASQRVDKFIANSKSVQRKILKLYGCNSEVIHPFTDSLEAKNLTPNLKMEPYYLIVSRLLSWKKIEIAIEACDRLSVDLLIAGEGPDRKRLEGLSSSRVKFLGYVSDEDKRKLMVSCKALLFPQEEDFGITPVEAMSLGKPVVAYRGGGAVETVVEGKTGMFFYPQSSEALMDALRSFDPLRYNSQDCISQAKKFNKEAFMGAVKASVESLYVQGS
ncbi:hypothetical protein A2716_03565 [candidate division WWE3 bacterium RIFCSPHIGHO2_01_FULL_40_23]|uniref:Glycosyl transferase family 1 domain-containing protein n=1 Tax=candidate division WWE3 bacterium RIFCSPLOWO2_01_FULL_41_18 TaxID=1802625 RepID=A0A1F4VD86_UNCKA|nr:MAG: hypothetical protein A2716_03565 [candidate division WWE3 bacterium RIFCSPHIGHO2_01_FULL_40_23]OGC54958.1 MAG: hypothetical protein A3A78_03175 [candidate division WWE3 bacterium RIFCSPLOWO2_01_FULL_41_18]